MKLNQIATLTNTITAEMLGDQAITTEDLTNIVDIGQHVMNQANWYDQYVKTLMDHVGRVVVTNKEYVPKTYDRLWRESFEFGAILERLTVSIPDAEDNPAWDLQDQGNYNSEIFYKPTVAMNLFNVKDTFQVPISIVEDQVRSAFSSREQYIAFIDGIYTAVNGSIKIRMELLAKRAINNMIGLCYDDAINTQGVNIMDGDNPGTVRYVNVLYMYNTQFNKSLTAVEAVTDPDFLRYFSFLLYLTSDRMREISSAFNITGDVRFTDKEDQNIFVLSEIGKALDVYLYSDVYHDEYVKLPGYETITAWQGITDGTDAYNFANNSHIKIKVGQTLCDMTGVLAVIFDREAVAVTNERQKVTAAYSARGDFTTYYYKNELGLINDKSMNCVVLAVVDAA